MKRIFLIYIIVVSAFPIFGKSLVEQGDSAYMNKEYHYAVRFYEDAISKYGVSAEILYNLGNAYYKSGNIAKSILNYERALKLKSNYQEARENIDFLNAKFLNSNKENSQTLSTSVLEYILNMFSANNWSWISLLLFVLMIGALLGYFYCESIKIRKLGFFGGIVLLIMFICSILLAIVSTRRSLEHNTAIVIEKNVELSSQPHIPLNNVEALGEIKAGRKIEIIDSISAPNDSVSPIWYDIKVGSKRAWIRANAVEKI